MDVISELFKRFKGADTPEEAARTGSALLVYAQMIKDEAARTTGKPSGLELELESVNTIIAEVSTALNELGLDPSKVIEAANARFRAAI
jgi:hypothetical protein